MDNRNISAPFDLKKTPKFDRKTDQKHLSKSFYNLAKEYYDASWTLLVSNSSLMSVILTNISFSCELFLKSILYYYEIDFKNTHGLEKLFKMLPPDISEIISKTIPIENRETEFPLALKEQDEAFVSYRYMCEAKMLTGKPIFLFNFATTLMYVYELITQNSDVDQHQNTAE